jgi:transposase InsO family protein
VGFVDEYKEAYGVEPICDHIQIAPSTYYEAKRREREPERLPEREKRDRVLEIEIRRIWDENLRVYGARKIWKALGREGTRAARCTVERLMKGMGIQGIRRGAKCWTTVADELLERPVDKVNRQFIALEPNKLWVADITFVATWSGFVYVAFITDAFANRIVGWRVAKSLHTDLVMDALEQAIWARGRSDGLIHHSVVTQSGWRKRA